MSEREAVAAIRKKLKGKGLGPKEIFAVMDEIAHQRLGPVLTTYFAAAGFSQGFTDEELYYLTRAMVETGDQLKFDGIVADKHSIGGVAGTRTTMIVVPIIAAAGVQIPKSSSRAITSAAGTADTMEVLAPVEFAPRRIEKIVNKVGGCIVWGGRLGLAPADDVMIQVEEPLAFESFDKIVVSVMAKKVATGSTHVVIDMPLGRFMKVRHKKDAVMIDQKFCYLAKRFGIKLITDMHVTLEPAGFGVGPVLEVKDVLAALNRSPDRPLKLEERALRLAGELLDLCYQDMPDKEYGEGVNIAEIMLTSGKALEKLREIVREQGGDPDFTQETLVPGKHRFELKAEKSGYVRAIDNKELNGLARILGSPEDKQAGIKLRYRIGSIVKKNDILLTLYSSDKWRLREARDTLVHLPIYYLED